MKLLHNARIHTLDGAHPDATVLAVENGNILALGGDELMQEFQFAQREDMRGQVILPGLVDAHIHLQEYTRSKEYVDCEADGKQEILERVNGTG